MFLAEVHAVQEGRKYNQTSSTQKTQARLEVVQEVVGHECGYENGDGYSEALQYVIRVLDY